MGLFEDLSLQPNAFLKYTTEGTYTGAFDRDGVLIQDLATATDLTLSAVLWQSPTLKTGDRRNMGGANQDEADYFGYLMPGETLPDNLPPSAKFELSLPTFNFEGRAFVTRRPTIPSTDPDLTLENESGQHILVTLIRDDN